MSKPIEVSQLQVEREHRAILRDVSLQLEAGATIGLIGRTGAGKTTLLRCMLGLAFADAGSARVFGEVATELSAANKARLGYVPQTPGLPGEYTVKGLVDLIGGWQPKWDKDWARELQFRFRLPQDTRISKLSGGEQQLLALVLALGHKPELLVLDEPVASLDPVVRRTVAATIAELQAERETSIIFSTHILSDLERLASHIAVIEDGRIGLLREADSIRQDVQRWQIRSNAANLPDRLSDAGVLHYRCHSRREATALVDVTQAAPAAALAEKLGAHIDCQPLGLEDFVVEYLQ
ncbi:ABC transporter ATP-binding protein [Uliginosibacterium sediminicola]|uniref:ABC transporter ATP-binding protein n=1 Tax=Uliginosibacterium sediminicola TaxID=2024550 RepID=A0ABU9YYU1_9RHOO